MNEEQRILVKAASLLLGYPDAELLDSLEPVEKILDGLPPSHAVTLLKEAVNGLRGKPSLQMQEQYTRLFDFSPATCLNLSYHKWGDGKERGLALAQMGQAYKKVGFSPAGGELPDYLPLVLEFLSVCPDVSFISMIKAYAEPLENLAARLDAAGSVYAQCVRAFLAVLVGSGPPSGPQTPSVDELGDGGVK